MVFGLLFCIPLIISLVLYIIFRERITFKEFMCQILVQAAIAGVSSAAIYYSNTTDTQLLHGEVTNKTRDEVSCGHSYECNCRQECSGSGDQRSCSRVCDTCYEHDYDVEWNVHSNINRSVEIDTIDRQGLEEPPRWTAVIIGEPFSAKVSYENYIKGSPDSLFRRQGIVEKYKNDLVDYRGGIHDYYRTTRDMTQGQGSAELNEKLQELNKILGPAKEASLALVVVKDKPQEYFYALEEAWLGGKKNEIIPVISIKDNKIQWVEILGWAKEPIFKIKLKDDILKLETWNEEGILNAMESNTIKYYQRKPMKDFEYLKSSIKPSKTQWMISLIIGIICALGISYVCWKEDFFEQGFRRGYKYY